MLIDKIWTKFVQYTNSSQVTDSTSLLHNPSIIHVLWKVLHFRLGGRNRKCNNRKCKNSLAIFKFIDKKVIISGSMLLCNIWIKLSNQHLCCLLEMEEKDLLR